MNTPNHRTGLWFTIAGAAILFGVISLGASVLTVAGTTGLMAPWSVQCAIVAGALLAVTLFVVGYFKLRSQR